MWPVMFFVSPCEESVSGSLYSTMKTWIVKYYRLAVQIVIIHIAWGYFTSRPAIILLRGIKPFPSKLSKGLCCEKGLSGTCNFTKSTETHLPTTKHWAFHKVDIALHPGHFLKRKAAQVLPQNRNSLKATSLDPIALGLMERWRFSPPNTTLSAKTPQSPEAVP